MDKNTVQICKEFNEKMIHVKTYLYNLPGYDEEMRGIIVKACNDIKIKACEKYLEAEKNNK